MRGFFRFAQNDSGEEVGVTLRSVVRGEMRGFFRFAQNDSGEEVGASLRSVVKGEMRGFFRFAQNDSGRRWGRRFAPWLEARCGDSSASLRMTAWGYRMTV